MYLLLFAGFLAAASPAAEAVKVNAADLQVMVQLRALYNKTLPELNTWNASADCTTWARTQCDYDRISKLDFQNTGLGGPLPEFITGLSRLRLLYADGNQWTGSLPESFTNLASLQLIRLNGNQLEGTLPASYSRLKNLYKFQMAGNNLWGNVPTTYTTFNLQEFYAFSNNFTGPFPTILCAWPGLQYLRMGDNAWEGPIPTCIGDKNRQLVNFYLDNCGPTLNGTIPANLLTIPTLANVFFNGNNLTGPIPSTVGSLTNLNTLFLSGNQITGPLPDTMGLLTALTAWVMEFNKIDGTIPQSIGNMTNVQRILLDNNRLTGTIPATLGQLKKLTILLLEGNELYGPVPPEIPLGCTNLVQFNVESNFLTGIPPGKFASTRLVSGQINYRSNLFSGTPSFTFPNGTKFCPPFWPNAWIHSSVAFNCFQNSLNTSCLSNDLELQKYQYSSAICQKYCGANSPTGPCGGHGFCAPNRTCICNSGYSPSADGLSCLLDAPPLSPPASLVPAVSNSISLSSLSGFSVQLDGADSLSGASSAVAVQSKPGSASAGSCWIGTRPECCVSLSCLDLNSGTGCSCLSGDSIVPSCSYSKTCLDVNSCPVLAHCSSKSGQLQCTCADGYRPLKGSTTDSFFQFCVKTKCQNIDAFVGFDCAVDEAAGAAGV